MWLKEGDQNSKFFHATAKNMRSVNQIRSLKNKDGILVYWSSGSENVMTGYFADLFTSTNTNWGPVTDCIQTKIIEEHNIMLTAEVSDAEVKNALFHMYLDKSPCPDGMSPRFYRKFWKIVVGDIVTIIKKFFET